MRSVIAAHQSRKSAVKSTAVVKRAGNDAQKPNRALRSVDDYFWYTSSDGIHRLATSSGTLNEVPRQINDYVFNPSDFKPDEYPSTIPKHRAWPPQAPQDLLFAISPEGEDCVGDQCYTSIICNNPRCGHAFEQFKHAAQSWQDYFELRTTDNRGVGAYTKKRFNKGDVLGWYAGELIPSTSWLHNSDYLMEIPIGSVPIPDSSVSDSDADDYIQTQLPTPSSSCSSSTTSVPAEETVMVDASKRGNWTRFINHSCKAHCEFRLRRVGKIRIMAIQAVRNVPAGVELTVNYGPYYFGPRTRKTCFCGESNCVSRYRKKRRGESRSAGG